MFAPQQQQQRSFEAHQRKTKNGQQGNTVERGGMLSHKNNNAVELFKWTYNVSCPYLYARVRARVTCVCTVYVSASHVEIEISS